MHVTGYFSQHKGGDRTYDCALSQTIKCGLTNVV